MSDASTADRDVSFRVSHGVGIITLNRPRARNALTTPMVLAMGERLRDWESDDRVRAVLIQNEKAFAIYAGTQGVDWQRITSQP